jgi:hypothetical protein
MAVLATQLVSIRKTWMRNYQFAIRKRVFHQGNFCGFWPIIQWEKIAVGKGVDKAG